MELSENFRSLQVSDTLGIAAFLYRAQCRVTFWGGRKVSVDGYEGSISLDEVAQKVNIVANILASSDDFSKIDQGRRITGKLTSFYLSTDAEIENAHWFTRLMNFIRELVLLPTPQKD